MLTGQCHADTLAPESLTIRILVTSNIELTLTNLQQKSVTCLLSPWIQLIVRDSGDALAFDAVVTYVGVDRI